MVSDEDVLRVLRAFNPWWSTGLVPARLAPPVRRAAFRTVRDRLSRPGWRRALILEGPRRVGKTTILYQLADAVLKARDLPARRVWYASFDHPVLKLARLDQVVRLAMGLDPTPAAAGRALLLLDEIQYSSDWGAWLKWLVDQHPQFQVLATGSASARLRIESTEPGVGRWVDVAVPPWSFYEYAALRDLPRPETVDIDPGFLWGKDPVDTRTLVRLVERTLPLEPHLHRYLILGGFPEVALLDDPQGLDLLRIDVVDRVLKRDMVALFNVRNVLDLERLFVYLCMHTGEIMNRQTLARDLGVTAATVDNHLQALELVHLLVLLPNVGMGGKQVLRTRPKAYVDPTLRNAVLMQGEDALTDATALGHLVESAVVLHTLAYARPYRPWAGYWRDGATQREIDLVLRFPGSTALLEVKYQADSTLRSSDGLLSYQCGEPTCRRWLITRRAEDAGVDPNTGVLRLPAFAYLYAIGALIA